MTRREHDNYPTPSWTVDRLLEEYSIDAQLVVEPAAGSGSLVRAFQARCVGTYWRAVDIMEEHREALASVCDDVLIGDYLENPCDCDAIIGNPPYKLARQFVEKAIREAPVVVFLLRLGFLSSAKRCDLLRLHTPSVYVLPNRPSYTGTGKTDQYDYAWFAWDESDDPIVRILNKTSRQTRRG